MLMACAQVSAQSICILININNYLGLVAFIATLFVPMYGAFIWSLSLRPSLMRCVIRKSRQASLLVCNWLASSSLHLCSKYCHHNKSLSSQRRDVYDAQLQYAWTAPELASTSSAGPRGRRPIMAGDNPICFAPAIRAAFVHPFSA